MALSKNGHVLCCKKTSREFAQKHFLIVAQKLNKLLFFPLRREGGKRNSFNKKSQIEFLFFKASKMFATDISQKNVIQKNFL
jgi:hypothetical protein